MKHFLDDDYDSMKEYEHNMMSHLKGDYDSMKEYESHIGCNYNDEFYGYSNDDKGEIKHFQD